MRQELESLLARSGEYAPLEWAKMWSKTAHAFSIPCFVKGQMVRWEKWLQEIESVADCQGLSVDIIKKSAISCLQETSQRIGLAIRLDCWWASFEPGKRRKWCQELVNIHQKYELGHAGFESYKAWRVFLCPARKVSL